MEFKFTKEVEGKVSVYDGNKVATGDTIELTGFFAEKAKRNPDFEEVIVEELVEEPIEEVKPRGNRKPAKSESA